MKISGSVTDSNLLDEAIGSRKIGYFARILVDVDLLKFLPIFLSIEKEEYWPWLL
jgi:hypothetical protein